MQAQIFILPEYLRAEMGLPDGLQTGGMLVGLLVVSNASAPQHGIQTQGDV